MDTPVSTFWVLGLQVCIQESIQKSLCRSSSGSVCCFPKRPNSKYFPLCDHIVSHRLILPFIVAVTTQLNGPGCVPLEDSKTGRLYNCYVAQEKSLVVVKSFMADWICSGTTSAHPWPGVILEGIARVCVLRNSQGSGCQDNSAGKGASH